MRRVWSREARHGGSVAEWSLARRRAWGKLIRLATRGATHAQTNVGPLTEGRPPTRVGPRVDHLSEKAEDKRRPAAVGCHRSQLDEASACWEAIRGLPGRPAPCFAPVATRAVMLETQTSWPVDSEGVIVFPPRRDDRESASSRGSRRCDAVVLIENGSPRS